MKILKRKENISVGCEELLRLLGAVLIQTLMDFLSVT